MITENTTVRDQILEAARRHLSRQREGIHVSSLIYPLKHYYRTKYPEAALSDRLVGFFMAGRGHHSIIQMLAAQPQYREVSVEWMGIRGTVDIFQDSVIEIKTTRIQTLLTPERIAHDHQEWILQIKYYCAMTGSTRAQLWLFYLGLREGDQRRTAPALQVFDVDPGDLEAIRAEMLGRKQLLEKAMATNNPSLLPPCPAWMCRDCEFGQICTFAGRSETQKEKLNAEAIEIELL
ncbi:MAG: PD-(D/E)XK nuclease family protein [Hadesarchaea archaeon]|nr:PD-(D/E)XK nuclease family protein [Hadesarchaea archaeon]